MYLVLDIGNVLFNQDLTPFAKALSIQMNISKEDAYHFINRIQKKQDLGISNIRDEIATHFNIKSEYIIDNLIDAWNVVITPNLTSIEFFSKLIEKNGYKIALLSSLGFEHMNLIKKMIGDYPIYKWSTHHFSCNVGARKPSLLYYKTFLDLYPKFKGALYLDDLQENLDAGDESGLSSRLFALSKHNRIYETEHSLQLIKEEVEAKQGMLNWLESLDLDIYSR